VFGLLVSIPIIVWGSQLVIKLMDRFPVIITAGAMLLGWIAGTLAVGDPLLAPWLGTSERWLGWLAGAGGALLVWVLGLWFQRRALAAKVAG
jgi:predicted tellurium resistance membrane protein TerC